MRYQIISGKEGFQTLLGWVIYDKDGETIESYLFADSVNELFAGASKAGLRMSAFAKAYCMFIGWTAKNYEITPQ